MTGQRAVTQHAYERHDQGHQQAQHQQGCRPAQPLDQAQGAGKHGELTERAGGAGDAHRHAALLRRHGAADHAEDHRERSAGQADADQQAGAERQRPGRIGKGHHRQADCGDGEGEYLATPAEIGAHRRQEQTETMPHPQRQREDQRRPQKYPTAAPPKGSKLLQQAHQLVTLPLTQPLHQLRLGLLPGRVGGIQACPARLTQQHHTVALVFSVGQPHQALGLEHLEVATQGSEARQQVSTGFECRQVMRPEPPAGPPLFHPYKIGILHQITRPAAYCNARPSTTTSSSNSSSAPAVSPVAPPNRLHINRRSQANTSSASSITPSTGQPPMTTQSATVASNTQIAPCRGRCSASADPSPPGRT
ncbi:hypothetical protein WR25_25287 [Diploscapter pachys]|uniref:Uncharacterized protein n=1 Tax=Diploscapter pachys TaxID=2018661 RepID=A0A2A2KFQ4_9BILA|nr:hypothetical protein WR25_25287 [Diploscapter pachys]